MNYKELWSYRITKRLWPSIEEMDEPQQLQAATVMIPVITLLPFAVIGLVWLILETNLDHLGERVTDLVIILITMLLLQNQLFTVRVRVSEDERIGLTSSLAGLVIWSAVLIAGPNALWIMVVSTLIIAAWQAWKLSRLNTNALWAPLSLFIQVMSNRVFAILVALTVFTAAGGYYPLVETSPEEWLPVLYATIVSAVIPGILILPTAVGHNQLTGQANTFSHLARFFIGAVGLTLVMAPFSLLAVLIFESGRTAALIVFMAGVFLVNALAHYLSQSSDRSARRAQEFSELEQLSEEILRAPVDDGSMAEILSAHISSIFPDDQVEIRLFDLEDSFWEALHVWRPASRKLLADKSWQQLSASTEPMITIPNVVLPGHKAAYGDAILHKITAHQPGTEAGESTTIGGIYLLRHPDIGRVQDAAGTVQSLAGQISSAVYRLQVHQETMTRHKMQQELEFAGQIQNSFLPEEIPEARGWELAAVLESARQTSGDFYDFMPLGEDKLGILVADVSDKGTGAALYMALSRTLIRTYAMDQHDAPEIAFSKANDRLNADSKSDQFVTAFYGVLDYVSGRLTYCNAGHNPPYLLKAGNGGEVIALERTGIPLGMFEGMAWQQGQAQLESGDVLLLYTDGVTEAQNMADELFDDQRLIDTGQANAGRSAAEIQSSIVDYIHDFVGQAPQFDDVTLMVVRRNGTK